MRHRQLATLHLLPHANIKDSQLSWTVTLARHQGKLVMVKHKDRTTFECPGGRREPGESITECAHRELYEETGASDYQLTPVAPYSILLADGSLSYGMLFSAEIAEFKPLPGFEMERVELFDTLPSALTYPEIIPKLLRFVSERPT